MYKNEIERLQQRLKEFEVTKNSLTPEYTLAKKAYENIAEVYDTVVGDIWFVQNMISSLEKRQSYIKEKKENL